MDGRRSWFRAPCSLVFRQKQNISTFSMQILTRQRHWNKLTDWLIDWFLIQISHWSLWWFLQWRPDENTATVWLLTVRYQTLRILWATKHWPWRKWRIYIKLTRLRRHHRTLLERFPRWLTDLAVIGLLWDINTNISSREKMLMKSNCGTVEGEVGFKHPGNNTTQLSVCEDVMGLW